MRPTAPRRTPRTPRAPRASRLIAGAWLLGALSMAGCGPSADRQHDATPGGSPETRAAGGEVAPQVKQDGRQIDWKAADSAMGRAGVEQPGNVRRYAMPRADLRVTVQGVAIRPGFALGSWVAITPHGDSAGQARVMAMGDLVLREDELSPVIDALQAAGIAQTAIHHHLVRESPRILYVHVHGEGDPVKLAQGVRAALARTGTPAAQAAPAPAAAPFALDTAAIARTLGHAGRVNGGVYQVSVPRAEAIREHGVEVPASMGLATVINFQPTGGGKAAITGDYVMLGSEVNAVIRALREHGIELVSLHNHALGEEPRLFFGHFWANDDSPKLARGLRAALDRTNSRRPGA